jgi:hypothetical protein
MKIDKEIESKLLDYIQNNLKAIQLENNLRDEETFPSEETLNQNLLIKDEKLLKELKFILKNRKSMKISNFSNLFIDIKNDKFHYELTSNNTIIRLNNSINDKISIDVQIEESIVECEDYSLAEQEHLTEEYFAEGDRRYDQMKDDLLMGN